MMFDVFVRVALLTGQRRTLWEINMTTFTESGARAF